MAVTMMISTAVLAAVALCELVQLIMRLRALFVPVRHRPGRETYNYDGLLSAVQGRRNNADGTWNRTGTHPYDTPGPIMTAMRYDTDGPLVLQDQATHSSRPLKEFAHDPDGNLLTDGRFNYTWNAENRLITVTTKDTEDTKKKKLEMVYDHMGRRTIKKVYSWVGNDWQLDKTVTFVYSGFNEVARFEDGTLSKTYIWGEDLSGSLQGAGGVGGLLLFADSTNNYAPMYDANGNVTGYVDANTGNQVAEFSYSPFGKLITKSGSKADEFDYKFSTKPEDEESGLYYYIHRHYDPEVGRWLSRDPKGEKVERTKLNLLYGFVGNKGVGQWDYLGLLTAYQTAHNYLAEIAADFNSDPDGNQLYMAGSLTGILSLIHSKLIWVLPKITIVFKKLKNPTYYPVYWNQLELPKGPVPLLKSDVFHESIHAYNDIEKGIGDDRKDEGIAWAAERIYDTMIMGKLLPLEKALDKGNLSIRKLQTRWSMLWQDAEGFYDYPASTVRAGEFKLTANDVKNVKSILGLKISCSEIAKAFNATYKHKLPCPLSCDKSGDQKKVIPARCDIPEEFE